MTSPIDTKFKHYHKHFALQGLRAKTVDISYQTLKILETESKRSEDF